jgi:hypothetical protein
MKLVGVVIWGGVRWSDIRVMPADTVLSTRYKQNPRLRMRPPENGILAPSLPRHCTGPKPCSPADAKPEAPAHPSTLDTPIPCT